MKIKKKIILEFLEQIKKADIKSSDKLLLAVSGGSDSVAMAHLCENLPNKKAIAYIDHKIRKESVDEKVFVRKLARKLKIPFYTKGADVDEFARKNKMSIEDAAREVRYRLLAEIAGRGGFTKILTAHTLTDKIETIFVKILRGGGINSFYGIKRKTKIFGCDVIRPLLGTNRRDLKKFLREIKYPFLTDYSNNDMRFLRNRIRKKIIPVFEKNFGKIFEKRLYEISSQADELCEFLEKQKKKISTEKRHLDIELYLSYNKFIRKNFLAEFLEGKANSRTVEKIDRFLQKKGNGSFSLRGFDFVIRKGKGEKLKK